MPIQKDPGKLPYRPWSCGRSLLVRTNFQKRVGMFGEISKDGESILEIAAWKRADEYCTLHLLCFQAAGG